MLQFISGSVSGSIFNSNVEGNILGKGVIVIFLLANIGLNENPLLLTCNERNSVKNNFRKSESNWGQILFRIFAIRRYAAECYQFIPIQV